MTGTPAVPARFGRTEGWEPPSGPQVFEPGSLDGTARRLLRSSFSYLMPESGDWMEYLFARLFVAHPDLRGLFPLGMARTRSAVHEMLARLVWTLDQSEETDKLLSQIARDHRKFGVRDKHYQSFFDALVATVEVAAGPEWTSETAAAWQAAVGYFRTVMSAAAAQDAKSQPAWWVGEVVQHERRTPTIAVLTIRPDKPLSYLAGQYAWVQVPRWPRLWRRYSIANPPRENGLIDLHVRAIPGGAVSTALVAHSGPGDSVVLGAPRGHLRLPADPERDIVCVAGGTGLAPVKAITEAVISTVRPGRRRAITVYVGARTADELYDMRDLQTLRLAYPPFTLVPVTEHGEVDGGQTGRLAEVVAAHSSFRDTDVYVSGPAGLVSEVRRVLTGRVAPERLHHDPLEALEAASRRPA